MQACLVDVNLQKPALLAGSHAVPGYQVKGPATRAELDRGVWYQSVVYRSRPGTQASVLIQHVQVVQRCGCRNQADSRLHTAGFP